MMIKKLILLTLLFNFTYAQELKLFFEENTIKNAQTALLRLQAKDISNAKLTLLDKETLNLNFKKNSFKKNEYYALIPISYYKKPKKYKVIISYFKNDKKYFKSIKLNVIDGKYKSETITVSKSKFKPNKQRIKRTKQEYKDAMSVYRSISEKILWNEDFIYPMNSKITSAFGTKRVYNNQLKSYHSGTDFRAKVGTPIIASNSGIVRIAQNRFYAGNSIVIDHGHGVYSCYYHLSKMNFKVGDFVKKGETIGLSGATGRITGPHLHYAFRINGIQVDPLQAIKILNKLNN
ncbi:M23 family metallopeptidase [Arcobacter roscoffensis]|uniref:M23 family metallopeptidase n=1 Tax=Arcobacter roscoffensis TaxID=2961520 RepID=A0ABY5E733_9BACT|nr:M23 family metallopeptidase [Arcobacter roscoffensis]UTJ07672.1 M23 family metallopeptidase [Arcobacter roscoffensis]